MRALRALAAGEDDESPLVRAAAMQLLGRDWPADRLAEVVAALAREGLRRDEVRR